MDHAPTPWAAVNDHPNEAVRANITYIKKVGDDEHASEICMFFASTQPEQAANIEFMLKAVNSHDALMAALASVIDCTASGLSDTRKEVMRNAAATLQKAKE